MATNDDQRALKRRHPFLRYVFLKSGISVLRFFSLGGQIPIIQQARRVPKTIVRIKLHIPSRDDGRTIRVTLYEQLPDAGDRKLLPAHINIHGSGFCIEALGADADFCSRLVTSTGTAVFDMTHRMAPEYPFPAGLEDVEDVLNHIWSQPETYDLRRVTISGFSAGGNLAVSISTAFPDRIKAVVGFYASVDLSRRYVAPTKVHDEGLKDRRASPLFTSTDRFPPHVFLACGNADALYDAAKQLVERLNKEGHPDASFLHIERESHAFDKPAREGSVSAKRKAEMYDKGIEVIRRAQDQEQKLPTA